MKGLATEGNIEVELARATVGAFSLVDDEGKELSGWNSVDGAAGAGAGAGVGTLGNAGGVRAKGFEIGGDGEGPAGFVKMEVCFSSAAGLGKLN